MAEKYRYFDFVTYEPMDKVLTILREEGGDYLVSPVHQPDGEHSKPHLHVMYCHGNTIRPQAARDLLSRLDLAVNGFVVAVEHPNNRQRYYLHLDDPEKQQFPEGPEALTIVRNFPLNLSKPLSEEERKQLPRRVLAFIREYNILEYSALVDALMDRDPDMFEYATLHTIFLGRYLDSRRYMQSDEDQEEA